MIREVWRDKVSFSFLYNQIKSVSGLFYKNFLIQYGQTYHSNNSLRCDIQILTAHRITELKNQILTVSQLLNNISKDLLVKFSKLEREEMNQEIKFRLNLQNFEDIIKNISKETHLHPILI